MNVRSVVGLLGVGLVLAAVVRWSPDVGSASVEEWRPPAGYAVADTVSLDASRTVRLWVGPAGWYVESGSDGRGDSAVGASGGRDQFAVSEVLGGFVGTVPTRGARAVTVRAPGGTTVRAAVHDGLFLTRAFATESQLLVTPLDAVGTPLTAEVTVPLTLS
ncbi:hypothetical protein [Asanoa hainanensis]|uniref:hypothetical protein n=1 Tax=Asanoa hainanensis TaxID=560556 RepID=UPI00117ED6AE|nr:hypothetical protein [Asanoa hainanensis]